MREHEFVCRAHREPLTKVVTARFGSEPDTPACPECGEPMKRAYKAIPMFTNWKRGRA